MDTLDRKRVKPFLLAIYSENKWSAIYTRLIEKKMLMWKQYFFGNQNHVSRCLAAKRRTWIAKNVFYARCRGGAEPKCNKGKIRGLTIKYLFFFNWIENNNLGIIDSVAGCNFSTCWCFPWNIHIFWWWYSLLCIKIQLKLN